MHPNSPGYDKKCSLRHPVSQPSPSGDADSIEEIKGLFAMLNLGHLRAMETPNTDVIIAAAWLRSHDAKVRSDSTFTDNNGEKCCSACCKPIFDAKVGQAEHGNAELLSEIIAMLKLRLATHIKHITTDDSGKQSVQPNGYAAVLVPDWQVKQWIATFEAALQESPSD